MKIGIMTFYDSYNYGAVLQAWALQQALLGFNAPSEIIAFERKKLSKGQSEKPPPLPLHRKIIRKYQSLRTRSSIELRNRRFDEFRSSFLALSTKRYVTADELWSCPPSYDAFICGSDQIWNPLHSDFVRLFMLEFAPSSKPRIAYAPSFGIEKMPDCDERDAMSKALSRFDYLSVRERSGVRIVEELCGRKATRVLDPTLLLNADFWSPICDNTDIPSGPYILLYALSPCSPEILKFIESIRRREKCQVVVVPHCKHNYDNRYKKAFAAGPREFLALVKNAKAVITNSFHGTAFSVLFAKPFCSFVGDVPDARRKSSRITDFLKILNLSDRFADPQKANSMSLPLDVDLAPAQAILDSEREGSLAYLRQALSAPELRSPN